MASSSKTYGVTKFSVETIQAAYEVFLKHASARLIREKITEKQLVIIRGGETRDFGKNREAFFEEYQSEDIEGAILEFGRSRRGSGFNFKLEYKDSDSIIEIELPDIELVDEVFKEFERVFETQTEIQEENFPENQSLNQDSILSLISGLNSSNPDTRANSAGILGNSNDKRAIDPLMNTLYDESDENVRRKIIEALGNFDDPRVYVPLRSALGDEDKIVKLLAIQAIGKVGDRTFLAELQNLFGDEDDEIQNAAKGAYENIRERIGIPSDDMDQSSIEESIEEEGTKFPPKEFRPERPTPDEIDIKIKALSDGVSSIDLLNYEDYAQALVDFISSADTEKPLTIGIDAAWGMGKTTLMEMIREKLGTNFHTVWFNAWKYDEEKTLWSALILETLSQLREDLSLYRKIVFWIKLNFRRLDRGKLREIILKNLFFVFILILVIGTIVFAGISIFWPNVTFEAFIEKLKSYPGQIGILAFFTLMFRIFKEAQTLLTGPFNLRIREYLKNPNYEAHIGFLQQLELDFEILLKLITDNGKKPLIVFIDDLDRCAPPNPVAIFEAINLILGAKHCVFIIGMDSRTVAGSIEARYKDIKEILEDPDDPGGLSLGQRFIEKIVQINFKIPKSEPETIENFIELNLERKEKAEEDKTKEEIKEAENFIESEQRGGIASLEEAVAVVRREKPELSKGAIEEAQQNIFAKSFDDSQYVVEAIKEVSPFLESNPRKIKKFINLFRLKSYIANRRGLLLRGEIDLKILANIIIFEMRWPDAVEAFMTDKFFIERLQKVKAIRKEQASILGDPVKWQDRQKGLAPLMADPIVAPLVDSDDLFRLMEKLPDSPKELRPYFQLNR